MFSSLNPDVSQESETVREDVSPLPKISIMSNFRLTVIIAHVSTMI